MITLTREEAQQVLDALEAEHRWLEALNTGKTMGAIETLCTRLSAPEPEPQEAIAKWIKTNTEHRQWYICPKCSYQAPRFKDEWQGLTDEDIGLVSDEFLEGVLWAEAKLKEKNND